MNKIKAIISGSDGTLINTLYLIRRGQYEAAVEYMVERGIFRHSLPSFEQYEQFINKSVGGSTRETLQKTLEQFFSNEHNKATSKEINYDELDRRLRPIQDRLAPLSVHPFPGLIDLLAWLGKEGMSFGIFTSGSQYHIVRNIGIAVPSLGFTQLYTDYSASEADKVHALIERTKGVYSIPKMSIVTCDDVTATKPDPEGVLKALDELGLRPEEVLVMGDLDADIIAGKKAGAPTIGVAHGFGTKKDLLAAGALAVASDLHEVIKLVSDHNSGKKLLV